MTDNHPYWSVDRQEFGKLKIGEHLRLADGTTAELAGMTRRPRDEPVYNLEIHGEHVYHVGLRGVLVHNSYRVYRAVSIDEYDDALHSLKFRRGGNTSFESGKWFSDSIEGAHLHGTGLHGKGKYKIIAADIPDGKPHFNPGPNLDGNGPSRFFEFEFLEGITPIGL